MYALTAPCKIGFSSGDRVELSGIIYTAMLPISG